jgi:pyrimidine operon attenuation protein/uracil phosphoribosyltransferase
VKLGHAEIEALIAGMGGTLAERLRGAGRGDLLVIGIHTGGVWIAERLRQRLGVTAPLGELNIAFYRDDFSRIGIHPEVRPSRLPFTIDDRHLILVDDVLHTGRTIRAAMNEIFDWGRPASISLAVLVDRGGRELPIQPDVAGKSLGLKDGQHVKLSGPEPLALEITGTG